MLLSASLFTPSAAPATDSDTLTDLAAVVGSAFVQLGSSLESIPDLAEWETFEPDTLPDDVLSLAVVALNEGASTFAEHMSAADTLLVQLGAEPEVRIAYAELGATLSDSASAANHGEWQTASEHLASFAVVLDTVTTFLRSEEAEPSSGEASEQTMESLRAVSVLMAAVADSSPFVSALEALGDELLRPASEIHADALALLDMSPSGRLLIGLDDDLEAFIHNELVHTLTHAEFELELEEILGGNPTSWLPAYSKAGIAAKLLELSAATTNLGTALYAEFTSGYASAAILCEMLCQSDADCPGCTLEERGFGTHLCNPDQLDDADLIVDAVVLLNNLVRKKKPHQAFPSPSQLTGSSLKKAIKTALKLLANRNPAVWIKAACYYCNINSCWLIWKESWCDVEKSSGWFKVDIGGLHYVRLSDWDDEDHDEVDDAVDDAVAEWCYENCDD